MHLSIKTLGAAIAATVAFGVAAPAVAAPPSDPGSVDAGDKSGQGSQTQKPGDAAKPAADPKNGAGKDAGSELRPKASKIADRISTRLARAITKRDARLSKAVETRLSHLEDTDVAAAVLENLAVVQATLADLQAAALTAPEDATNLREVRGDLREVRKGLRELRLVNYIQVANLLNRAERLQGVVDANTVALEAATGVDLSAAVAANEEAAAALSVAVEKALEITALAPRSAVREVRMELVAAAQALAVVAEALEPVEQEPSAEEPAAEEPTA
jgi:hypothetical protein